MDLLLRIKWRPGIGDPTFMGWFTVLAYAVAVFLCWRAYQGNKDKIWFWVTVVMAALCVNKQLDLQSLLTDLGRQVAYWGDWYKERRGVQKVFVFAVIAGAGAFAAWFGWRFRDFLKGHKLLAGGMLFLLTFIVVRAISFHHIDLFLKTSISGVRPNWVLELGGIAMIAVAALRERSLRGK